MMAAGMGFLGALGGFGKGVADVGDTMMRDTIQRRQQEQDDERRMRIEEFRVGEARAEGERQYARGRSDKLADDKADREHDIAKIREMAKTKGASQSARTRLYPMGEDLMGNKIFGRYDEETDTLIPVAPEEAPASDVDAMAQAEQEASKKAGWFRSDETDFGPAGRDAWIKNRALELQGKKPQNGGVQKPTSGAPYPDGTRLRGKDGKMYEVKNGQPVPVQ